MAGHNDLGKLGEEMAAAFLLQKGYEILETNWTFQKAEVDIIARKNDVIAVVEVKTRSSIDFGLPQDFVKPKKIRLLVNAVDQYINENDLVAEVRFDIIAVHNENGRFWMEHLENAFFHF